MTEIVNNIGVPLAPFIRPSTDGSFQLHGYQCKHCEEVFTEHHRACPCCAAVSALIPTDLAHQGRLFTYTIVHRSFPGIQTPFISAIVKLESGGFVRGNLVGLEARPEFIQFDMPVKVEFERLAGLGESQTELIRHVFVPADQAVPQ